MEIIILSLIVGILSFASFIGLFVTGKYIFEYLLPIIEDVREERKRIIDLNFEDEDE